jgi:hypothetical protein
VFRGQKQLFDKAMVLHRRDLNVAAQVLRTTMPSIRGVFRHYPE